LSNVVLPQPEGPMIATIPAHRTVKSTPRPSRSSKRSRSRRPTTPGGSGSGSARRRPSDRGNPPKE
jgi:hypothetical protein